MKTKWANKSLCHSFVSVHDSWKINGSLRKINGLQILSFEDVFAEYDKINTINNNY